MIYIIVALKSEAQAFVDKYKLDKSKENEQIKVLTSGLGEENMYKTTMYTLTLIDKEDILINIGICGASSFFSIGDLLQIDAQSLCILGTDKYLSCADEAIEDTSQYDAVDMESAGFIRATQEMHKRYIFKIVSDHFEPSIITKEKTKKLIFDKIDAIMETINE